MSCFNEKRRVLIIGEEGFVLDSKNDRRRVVKQDPELKRRRRIMTIAESIQEMGNEVFAALPASLSEELTVAIRELHEPQAELETGMLKKLEEALPVDLRKKIINSRTYALGGGFTFPSVKATCTINKNEIAAGESAIVSVFVDGDEVHQSSPVPTAVLLTLDESGSMKYDGNYKQSRLAASNVISSLRSVDEVGLVTFSDKAVVCSQLTTNHQDVKTLLQKLGTPSGATNLEDAIKTSNKVISSSTKSYNRMVILFTDGMPFPNPVTQEQNILNGLGTATSNLIHYYTVGYGSSIPVSLLQILAMKTGGKFYPANDIMQLVNLFKNAFDDVKDTLFSREVIITQIVNPQFKVKPNSLNYSKGMGEEPPGFQSAIKSAEANFYNTGKITFPALPILRKNRHFSYHFEVTAKKCSAKDQIIQVTSPQSSVKYTAGAGTSFTTPINTVSVKVKACGVYWKKTFDQANRRVIIEINNTYSDRKVTNVRVVEVTGEEVRPIPSTALPFGWPHTLPYYPSHAKDVWGVYGVEWNLPTPIPANTVQKFSVEVELLPNVDDKKHGFDNPVQINQVEVPPKLGPDGGVFNEPKEGGVIEYQILDNNGVKKKLVIKLPGLTVNSLPHKWP
jgi:uncharacterized protein YegL